MFEDILIGINGYRKKTKPSVDIYPPKIYETQLL